MTRPRVWLAAIVCYRLRMPPAHRVGDKALNPADAHGCPACPHPVQGPGTSGSPDVFVNNMPQMRVGDPGMHAACCGPNSWTVAQGSSSVFVNNIPPSRIGDATTHCGGSGKVIEGSPNVIIGDYTCAPPPPPPPAPPLIPKLVEALPLTQRFFINLPDDEGRGHGRKVTVRARVDPPQGGVPIRFDFMDVAGNAVEFEGSDDLLSEQASLASQTATTDGSGIATTDLRLSQVAGDRIQVRATNETDGTIADTGLQEVWRKLKFDVILMKKPDSEQPYMQWLRGSKTYNLEDDLEFAKRGLAKVFIELEDTGRRYYGDYEAVSRAEDVEAWCERACPPGPSPGEEPVIHLAVVNTLLAPGFAFRQRPVTDTVDLTHEGGGVYSGTLRKAPWFERGGHVFLDPGSMPWIDNPAVSGVAGWPVDGDGVDLNNPFQLMPVGDLGTRDVTLQLPPLPDRLGGGHPEFLRLLGLKYYELATLAGYCPGGGRYVVVGEQFDGEVLMHEIGHALGLCNTSIQTNDGTNHCSQYSCAMFYADDPSTANDFHGGPTPGKGTCAHWLRRLNMSKDHLYARWWEQGGWPEHASAADADGCPCGPGMFHGE